MRFFLLRRAVVGALLGVFAAISGAGRATADTPLVFAAASLKNALDDVNAAWKAQAGKSAKISYAASSALAKQIEQGAPADLFISADLDWMQYLAGKKVVKPESVVQLLGNRIVLVAPADTMLEATIAPGFDLAGLLKGGKLAMADVNAVPAGKYGKAALEALGVWASVEANVAQAENVRVALKLVSAGEAALGIVYRTDARADDAVEVVDIFPESTHAPIVYPAGLTAASTNADAAEFLTFMRSATAAAIFEDHGFAVLASPSN